MAVQTFDVLALDPSLYTGPVRMISNCVVRTVTPTLDSFYGTNGTLEYMKAIYVGVTGNVSYTKWDGTNETLVGLTAGVWHMIGSIKINTAGTTATGIKVGS